MTAGLLAQVLEDVDLPGFGAQVAADLLRDAHDRHPELAFLPDELLCDLLGGAAVEGVARIVSACTLAVVVEGDPGQDGYRAVAETVETVRDALALLVVDPETPQDVAAERAAVGYQLLSGLVTSWDAANEPEPDGT